MRHFIAPATAVITALAASPLMAQIPPRPGPVPVGNLYISFAVGLALFALVMMPALKSSKRSHQD
jgi:hypothetical protein